MFGIDDFLLMSALGGGLGALTSKKPLQGALLGAGLGAAGGALAPSLFGGVGAAGSAATVPANPFIPEAAGGLLGGMKTAMDYVKPIGQAAGAASQAGLLGHQPQPITPSPMMTPSVGGNQVLNQLAQAPSENAQQMQMAEQMRQRRRMGLLGGGYGIA